MASFSRRYSFVKINARSDRARHRKLRFEAARTRWTFPHCRRNRSAVTSGSKGTDGRRRKGAESFGLLIIKGRDIHVATDRRERIMHSYMRAVPLTSIILSRDRSRLTNQLFDTRCGRARVTYAYVFDRSETRGSVHGIRIEEEDDDDDEEKKK